MNYKPEEKYQKEYESSFEQAIDSWCPVCPYCFKENDAPDMEHFDGYEDVLTCERCEKEFNLITIVQVSFVTQRLEEDLEEVKSE